MERKLKYASWSVNDLGELILRVWDRKDEMGRPIVEEIYLSKTYSYSLGRFLIRVWQSLASRKRRNLKKTLLAKSKNDAGNLSRSLFDDETIGPANGVENTSKAQIVTPPTLSPNPKETSWPLN